MKKTVILFLILSLGLSVFAQQEKAKTEANYLIGFSKLLSWNNYSDNLFVINCVGGTDVMDFINARAINIKTGGKKIIARETTIDNLYNCNILFIAEDKISELQNIIENPLSNNILVVTDMKNTIQQGADVSFEYSKISTTDSLLSYRINLQSIRNKNIKIAPEFIGYGINE